MKGMRIRKAPPLDAARLLIASCVFALLPLGANAQDISAPLDENSLFGGSGDIVTTIDAKTAAEGVQLVKDSTTYPVFSVEGDAGGGAYGSLVPYGATSADSQSIFGAVSLSGLTVDFLPSKDLHFETSLDGIFIPGDAKNVTANAYADLRASEFTRLYVGGTFTYKPQVSDLSTQTQGPSLVLDELFVDTAIDRKIFFRMGKQRISWGVGNWYKPADVLSLAAIDPDNPTAAREGPYAFKVDTPLWQAESSDALCRPAAQWGYELIFHRGQGRSGRQQFRAQFRGFRQDGPASQAPGNVYVHRRGGSFRCLRRKRGRLWFGPNLCAIGWPGRLHDPIR